MSVRNTDKSVYHRPPFCLASALKAVATARQGFASNLKAFDSTVKGFEIALGAFDSTLEAFASAIYCFASALEGVARTLKAFDGSFIQSFEQIGELFSYDIAFELHGRRNFAVFLRKIPL